MSIPIGIQSSSEQLIEPKRIPAGFLLTDRGDAWSWRTFTFLTFLVSIWCGVSFYFFSIQFLEFLAAPSFGSIFTLLFLGFFVAIGIMLIGAGIHWLTTIAKLRPGEIILSSYPLRMGESCQVRYRRQLRSGFTPCQGRVTATWLCYEWARRNNGEEGSTKILTLWEKSLPAVSVPSRRKIIEYETEVMAPPQWPPSFEAANNKIRWELRITVELPGVVSDTSFFRFRVIPEVV